MLKPDFMYLLCENNRRKFRKREKQIQGKRGIKAVSSAYLMLLHRCICNGF